MADPLSILGAVGSIVGIIDITCKVISRSRTLQARFKNAGFILLNVASQLNSFRIALAQIQIALQADSFQEPHYLLAMDMGLTLDCCERLINRMDTVVEEIESAAGSQKVARAVAKKFDELEELHRKCNPFMEQRKLLSKTSSRKTMQAVQEDSVSLLVHYDRSSLLSRYTDTLSKISRVFGFDRDIFQSRPYERVLRYSMKDVFRRQPSNALSPRVAAVAACKPLPLPSLIDEDAAASSVADDSPAKKQAQDVVITYDDNDDDDDDPGMPPDKPRRILPHLAHLEYEMPGLETALSRGGDNYRHRPPATRTSVQQGRRRQQIRNNDTSTALYRRDSSGSESDMSLFDEDFVRGKNFGGDDEGLGNALNSPDYLHRERLLAEC